MTRITTLLTTTILMLFSATLLAQDSTLNSSWDSTYESAGGADVNAQVTLKKNRNDQFGSGTYRTRYGNGSLSQVRKEINRRNNTPRPSSNGPLPGPNSPNSGATANEAVYIKGIWDFQGSTGWFSWELYETRNGECKFLGKWGFVQRGRPGPVKGSWNGDLDAGWNGNNGPASNGPLIPIPF